jgi:hypothetical protein
VIFATVPVPFTRLSLISGCVLLVHWTSVRQPVVSTAQWYRGNTHTHTTESDGDSTPDEVARWYKEAGYQFLVLSDHNVLTSVESLNAAIGSPGAFLVIRGEEVTSRLGAKPLHVNGLDVNTVIPGQTGGSVVEILQKSVDGIRRASGVPHVNHPNYGWAITADELAAVRDTTLFEIYNGHPQVNNLGGGGTPGLEEVWDRILSSGKLLYGIAVDDAHVFKRPWDPMAAKPGRGWVMVRAARLEPRAILGALERGEFYATTGVELESYQATPSRISVSIKPTGFSRYRVQFIGKHGRILSEVATTPATYEVQGNEGYVRAKVIESNGAVAWLQPVGVGSGAPK